MDGPEVGRLGVVPLRLNTTKNPFVDGPFPPDVPVVEGKSGVVEGSLNPGRGEVVRGSVWWIPGGEILNDSSKKKFNFVCTSSDYDQIIKT